MTLILRAEVLGSAPQAVWPPRIHGLQQNKQGGIGRRVVPLTGFSPGLRRRGTKRWVRLTRPPLPSISRAVCAFHFLRGRWLIVEPLTLGAPFCRRIAAPGAKRWSPGNTKRRRTWKL